MFVLVIEIVLDEIKREQALTKYQSKNKMRMFKKNSNFKNQELQFVASLFTQSDYLIKYDQLATGFDLKFHVRWFNVRLPPALFGRLGLIRRRRIVIQWPYSFHLT